MIKILFFIERLGPGGKERRLIELIKRLSNNRNFEMQIVLTQKEIHYTEIFDLNIKIHFLIRKKIKKDPRIFFKFYEISKKFNPNVIHAWGNMVAFYAIPSVVFLKIPLLNNQITDAPLKISNSFFGPRTIFKFSDKIIANSLAGIKAYNPPKEKCRVIYNGFDFNRIAELKDREVIRREFGIKTKFVVGMVATFYEKKDYATYLKAASLVLSQRNDITFLCIGDGDDGIYKEMVETSNRGNILFLGKQNNVENLMNICDIGVLCTITEGISNSLLEFMSLKKPILVTGSGGCSELIETEKNGYLMTRGSYEELANKMIFLLNNDSIMKEFGEESRLIVETKFSIEKMLSEYENLYNEYSS